MAGNGEAREVEKGMGRSKEKIKVVIDKGQRENRWIGMER
jgi:hypothetical protein